MPDSTHILNSDLTALATRLRDGADNMLADRSMATDLRAAADLVSRWAYIGRGWADPDLSHDAIFELNNRLILACDENDNSPAIETTDVFLAWRALDEILLPLLMRLRALPNAPQDTDFRDTARLMLQGVAEPYTAEQIASFDKQVES